MHVRSTGEYTDLILVLIRCVAVFAIVRSAKNPPTTQWISPLLVKQLISSVRVGFRVSAQRDTEAFLVLGRKFAFGNMNRYCKAEVSFL